MGVGVDEAGDQGVVGEFQLDGAAIALAGLGTGQQRRDAPVTDRQAVVFQNRIIRLDGDDPSIVASGHSLFDLGMAKQINRRLELNLSLDNLTSRGYYETQNYFESRVRPDAPVIARIHATPGYPLSAIAGITMRFGGK